MADEPIAGSGFEGDPQATLGGNSGEVGPEPELTLDDLFDEHVDVEAIKAAEKAMSLPKGNYTTVPPLKLTIKPGKTGRKFTVLSGEVFSFNEATGKETRGRTSYFVSWIPRNSHIWADGVDTGEDSGKPDGMTKLYIQAQKAYLKAFGESAVINPETGLPGLTDIIAFLRDFEHRLYIAEGRDGQDSRVVSISAVPEQSA